MIATGIHSIRIDHSIKQGIDQALKACFLLIESRISQDGSPIYKHTVSQMGSYLMLIVNQKTARKSAMITRRGLQKNETEHACKIINKPGSYQSRLSHTVNRRQTKDGTQGGFS